MEETEQENQNAIIMQKKLSRGDGFRELFEQVLKHNQAVCLGIGIVLANPFTEVSAEKTGRKRDPEKAILSARFQCHSVFAEEESRFRDLHTTQFRRESDEFRALRKTDVYMENWPHDCTTRKGFDNLIYCWKLDPILYHDLDDLSADSSFMTLFFFAGIFTIHLHPQNRGTR